MFTFLFTVIIKQALKRKEMDNTLNNTLNGVCRKVIDLLAAHGVKKIFLSPGSRNAPLAVAACRHAGLDVSVVIDERSAAFMALGYSLISSEPVAIVCTSGTAPLNYAPAIAEAFYRKLPLIVVTADRPMEWIDQDDSQTINQQGVYGSLVKKWYDIPATCNPETENYAARVVNDALLEATTGRRAPVHINVRIGDPVCPMGECNDTSSRPIELITPRQDLTTADAREIGRRIASPRRVMIVAGFGQPDRRLNTALARLSQLPNFIILTETIANLHGKLFLTSIDTLLSALTDEERTSMAPDVVITLGGALVSRHIKQYLRSLPEVEHWHVGLSHTTIDCFRHLTMRVEMEPSVFFMQLASAMQPHREDCSYADRWQIIADRAASTRASYIARSPWTDLKAFSTLLGMLPGNTNLQLSNGTAVRYAQILAPFRSHRCDCNRGVSGIDGCTSTAIGAAMAYSRRPTLLISGDMSAQYDVGALISARLAPNFRMVVVRNSGGAIFRFVNTTASLPEREEIFAVGNLKLPLRQLADAYELDYYEAASEEQLRQLFPKFIDISTGRPAILAIDTPAEESAETLRNFFNRNKTLQQ